MDDEAELSAVWRRLECLCPGAGSVLGVVGLAALPLRASRSLSRAGQALPLRGPLSFPRLPPHGPIKALPSPVVWRR